MPNCPAMLQRPALLDAAVEEEDHAFSPASSSSSGGSSMSVSSSPVPSPAESTASSSSSDSNVLRRVRKGDDDDEEDDEECPRRPKRTYCYRDSYEAKMQRPLAPCRTLGINNDFPKATHRSDYDERLQDLFHLAVSRASVDELDAILRNNSESIDLNRYDEHGQTPLQRFVQDGNLGLVKLLVQYGADVKMRTREGWSVIHIASFAERQSQGMIAYLLKFCNKR